MVSDNAPRKRLRDRRNQAAGKRLVNDTIQMQKDKNQEESSVKCVFLALTCGVILTILVLVANHNPNNDIHKKDESTIKIKMLADHEIIAGEMNNEKKNEINNNEFTSDDLATARKNIISEVNVSQEDEHTNETQKAELNSLVDERGKLMTEDLVIEERVNEDLMSDIDVKDNLQFHNKQSPNLSDELDEVEVEYNADAIGDWTPSGAAILAREIEACASSNEEFMSSDSETQIDDSGMSYENRNITNDYDWRLRHELDLADVDFEANKVEKAFKTFESILRDNPESVRAKYGIAKCLHAKADAMKSNDLLKDTIAAYMNALNDVNITDTLFEIISTNALNRTRFKGDYLTTIQVHEKIVSRFPDNAKYQDDMAVTYLMLNRITEAKGILEEILRKWNNYSPAMVHYGFILKTENKLEEAVKYLSKGIDSNEPGTQESKFYFHLGDALNRLGRREQAMRVYEKAVSKGMFLSKYQRSLYNVDRLLGKPWWSLEETGYESYFKKLEDNWKIIRDEALKVENVLFQKEGESLCEKGDWRQLELYSRGMERIGCKKVPFTCKLIGEFEAAAKCKRGQVKLSLMQGNTHVWAHCGPTNTRLRAHLGLVIPPGTIIRVAEESRNWQEGKVIVLDDSFEHEVWHNGTSPRLLLIVDVWHPQLTNYERRILAPI